MLSSFSSSLQTLGCWSQTAVVLSASVTLHFSDTRMPVGRTDCQCCTPRASPSPSLAFPLHCFPQSLATQLPPTVLRTGLSYPSTSDLDESADNNVVLIPPQTDIVLITASEHSPANQPDDVDPFIVGHGGHPTPPPASTAT